MNTSKKILIYPTDLLAINPVADYGVLLAKKLNLPALLIDFESVPIIVSPHFGMTPVMVSSSRMTMDRVVSNADFKLENMQRLAKKLYEKTDYEVQVGFAEAKLIEKAKDQEILMLVIGQSSNVNFLDEWLGTFETRVAEDADCPVLVIPEEVSWKPVEKILYLMDLQDDKFQNVLSLSNIAQRLNAEIEIITFEEAVTEAKMNAFEDKLESFKQLANNQNISCHFSNYKNPDERASSLMQLSHANWLAFQKKDKGFLERLFSKNHLKKLILESDFPVFVF